MGQAYQGYHDIHLEKCLLAPLTGCGHSPNTTVSVPSTTPVISHFGEQSRTILLFSDALNSLVHILFFPVSVIGYQPLICLPPKARLAGDRTP